ncbi:MAG: UbiA-like protein EboC [Balneolaceae bacterium]
MNSSFSVKFQASLELMRPANIVTAFADILAGAAAAMGILSVTHGYGFPADPALFWLLVSTFGLYGGGIVFNDVFDAPLDEKERPERAIPSGRISRQVASVLGATLFLIGIGAAFWVNSTAGIIATATAVLALLYDANAKHSVFFGPLIMGSCRAGNLLLGAAFIPSALELLWPLGFIPIFYIGSITLISRGEVHGGSKRTGILATSTIIAVTSILALLSLLPEYELIRALPFILIFGGFVIPAYFKATFDPSPGTIKKAVKRGVISLIILNSAIAAGFGGFVAGLLVLSLLPLSYWFSRIFAVT